MTNTLPNSKGNNAMLTQSCELAYTQFKEQLATLRSKYHDNPDAQSSFNEIDAFLNPLLSKLSDDMNAASTIQEQKELLLKLLRSSFNEVMMVSGRDDILSATKNYICDVADAYTAQRKSNVAAGKFAGTIETLADPGGSFQAVNDYMNLLKITGEAIDKKPAHEVREKHQIQMGPVTKEQRVLLLKESDKILRGLGDPFIDKEMPFQPDMLGITLFLMMDPKHIRDLMQGTIEGRNAMPSAIIDKWNKLQRDYPDMATNVSALLNATIAQGRGHSKSN